MRGLGLFQAVEMVGLLLGTSPSRLFRLSLGRFRALCDVDGSATAVEQLATADDKGLHGTLRVSGLLPETLTTCTLGQQGPGRPPHVDLVAENGQSALQASPLSELDPSRGRLAGRGLLGRERSG
jgi:hypothetical protein